jgi:small subunit ribosomal protein S6
LETVTKQLYEGMFLVDVARASSDWDSVISTIKKILERVGAEIISMKKWDDRKLAYDIKGQSRGVYILSYFRVDGSKITEIENNLRLSEQVMRTLILNAEQMTQEDIEKETPAAKAEKEGIKPVEEAPEAEAEEQQDIEQENEEEQDWEAEENENDSQESVEDIEESELDSNPDEQA